MGLLLKWDGWKLIFIQVGGLRSWLGLRRSGLVAVGERLLGR